MADLKKTVAIEFETNAAKAAKDTRALATAERDTAKAADKAAGKQKQLAEQIRGTKDRTRVLNMELKNAKARLADMNAGSESLGSRLVAARGKIAAFAAATAAAAAVINEAVDRSFAFQAVSQNLPFSIDKARKSTQGLVDDMTLMRNAITANRLGVAKTSEEYEKIVRIGQKLALSTGQDASKGVEDLTTALARQSPMILDNLGISLKLGEAYKRYADRLGVTVNELTDAQKKQAFMNEALIAGEEAAAGVSLEFDQSTLKAKQFKSELIDVANVISVEVLAAFSDLSSGVQLMLDDMLGKAIQTAAAAERRLGALQDTISHEREMAIQELLTQDTGMLIAAQNQFEENTQQYKLIEEALERRAQPAVEAAQLQAESDIARFGAKKKAPRPPTGRGAADDSIATMSDSEARGIQAEIEGSIAGSQDFSEEEEAAMERFEWEREHQQKLNDMHAEAERERAEQMKAAAAERQRIIEDEMRKREAAMRAGFAAFQSIGNETIALSRAVVSATGASSEEQARKMNKVTGIITTVQGVAAIAQGAIEVAAQNYGKGIPMIIAGTAATVTGASMIANPLNPPGVDGGGGGGAAAGANNVPTGGGEVGGTRDASGSPISRPGTGSPPQQGGQNTSPTTGQQTKVYNFDNVTVLGATREEVGNALTQLMDDSDRQVGNA